MYDYIFPKYENLYATICLYKSLITVDDKNFPVVTDNACEFTIANFPLMNLNDLITLAYMIKTLDDKYVTNKKVYVIGYAYLKNYIDFYFAHLGLFDFEITKTYNKPEKNPKTTIDDVDLEQYDDGEILLKALGVVFQGKKIKGKQKKHFFDTDVKDMYSTTNLTNILFRIV